MAGYFDSRCKHYELTYECDECRLDPKTCPHKESVSRWHYDGDKLKGATGFCYDCGKEDFKYNPEKKVLE